MRINTNYAITQNQNKSKKNTSFGAAELTKYSSLLKSTVKVPVEGFVEENLLKNLIEIVPNIKFQGKAFSPNATQVTGSMYEFVPESDKTGTYIEQKIIRLLNFKKNKYIEGQLDEYTSAIFVYDNKYDKKGNKIKEACETVKINRDENNAKFFDWLKEKLSTVTNSANSAN